LACLDDASRPDRRASPGFDQDRARFRLCVPNADEESLNASWIGSFSSDPITLF
jgi:hypothetical protein